MRSWKEGKSLIFDDSHPHEVWNDCDSYRVVLFVDFLRPVFFPASLLNRLIIWMISRTSSITEPMDRIREKARAAEKFQWPTRHCFAEGRTPNLLSGIENQYDACDLNLRPGDFVEVKSPAEILQTLDTNGTLDRLPFMPEMVNSAGRRFRVSKRVVKTCYYGTSSGMRKFPAEDVVLLEGLRCSGAAHDGCQKACTIFWREAWLRRVDGLGTIAIECRSGKQQVAASRGSRPRAVQTLTFVRPAKY